MGPLNLITLPLAMSFFALSSWAGDAPIISKVTLIAYSAEKFPDLAGEIKPYMAGFEQNAMVMLNDSEKDITATTVVWSYKSIQRGGNPQNVTAGFDNYFLPTQNFHPVVAAHSKTLLAPSATGFARFKDADGGKLQIELDSVVFADGEIQGPDLLDAGANITSRYQAGQLVAGRIHTGRVAGIHPAQIAENLVADAVRERPGSGHGLHWIHQYQMDLAHISDRPEHVDAFLGRLDNMVKPPTFYKNTAKAVK